MLGRLGFIGLLCLCSAAYAAPGDIDTMFAEATTFRAAYPVMTKDGSLWVGGAEEMIHLAPDGKLIERYSCSGSGYWVRPLAHPKGGVLLNGPIFIGEKPISEREGPVWIQANGEVAADFKPPRMLDRDRGKFYTAGDFIWIFKDRKLSALDEKGAPLAAYTYPWWHVSFISSAPNGTVAVMGREMSDTGTRGGRQKLVYYSAKDGTVVSEHERPSLYDDSITFLEDGRFLVSSRKGITRYLSNGEIDPSYRSPFGALDEDTVLAPRPDGRIMIAASEGQLGDLVVDEDDDYFILARLTKDGDLDTSFPNKEPVHGDPSGMVATDEWTYYEGLSFNRIRATRLYRIDSGDLPLTEDAIVFESVSEIAIAGSSLTLQPNFQAHASMSFQWYHDGELIEGATKATLTLKEIEASDSGVYEIEIAWAQGRSRHRAGRVQVCKPLPGTLDRSKEVPQEERLRFVRRSREDERWYRTPGEKSLGILLTDDSHRGHALPGRVMRVVELEDGKVMILGSFTNVNEVERDRIARLNADDSLDLEYEPPYISRRSEVALLPDGSALVSIGQREGGAKLIKLGTDGKQDEAFECPVTVASIFPQPDGSLYVTRNPSARFENTLLRLLPNGSVDTSFQASITTARLHGVDLSSDGKLLAYGTAWSRETTDRDEPEMQAVAYLIDEEGLTLQRHLSDLSKRGGRGASQSVQSAVRLDDGRLILSGNFESWHGLPRLGAVGLLPDGRLDPSFGRDWNVERGGQLKAVNAGRVQFFSQSLKAMTWGDAVEPVPPLVALAQRDLHLPKGSLFDLNPEVVGYPIPTMQWEKDGVPLPSKHGRRITLQSITDTDVGTYRLRVRSEAGESLSEPVRLSIGQDPKALEALELAKGGSVLKENTRHLGNASVGAFPRGDGYDDLIVAEWGPIKGLVRLVNSKDPEKPWQKKAIRGDGDARVGRRIAIGRIDGDELDDVLEWRSPVERKGRPSMHWYRGEEKDGQRTLSYDGVLDCANLPSGVNFADVCLADIDGDGDHDILARGARSMMHGHFFREDIDTPSLVWWRNDGVGNPWPAFTVDDAVSYAGISVITEDDDSPPASNLLLEDLDGDNDPDIAIVPLKETVAQTWFVNEAGKFTVRGLNLATGERFGDEATGPTIADSDRPALIGYQRWKGRVVARADVNGDGVPDRILAYPGFEIDDDDSDRTWQRGLEWENGKEAPALPNPKGGMVLLPLLFLRRRNRGGS